jgi:hypothetical protein
MSDPAFANTQPAPPDERPDAPAWQRAAHSRSRSGTAAVAAPWWQLPPLPESARGRGYPAAHWRGELDLTRSLLLNLVLPVLLLHTALSLALAHLLLTGAGLPWAGLPQLLGWPALSVLAVWGAVGAWRASRARLAEGSSASVPVASARVGIVLVLLQVVLSLGAGALPQFPTLARLLVGSDPLGAAQIDRADEGRRLQLRGAIGQGDAERFAAALAAAPDLQRVELASPGGRAGEAHRIAALIRQRGLATRAVGACRGACVEVFLAGRERQLSPGAQLALWRVSADTWNPWSAWWAGSAQAAQLRALGLPPAAVDKVLHAPPYLPWAPGARELAGLGLVSAQPATLELALPSRADAPLVDYQDALAMHPAWQAIARQIPGIIDDLAPRLVAARAAGADEAELQALAWATVAPHMPRLVNGADAILRRRYVELLLAELKALRDQPAAAGHPAPPCRELLGGQIATRLQLPLELRAQETEWIVDAAEAPMARGGLRPAKPIELEVVRRGVGAGAPGLLQGVWPEANERPGPAPECATAIALIERTAAQTPARRDLAERLFFLRP